MSEARYAAEVLDGDDDNGTMPQNVEQLRQAVIGHRIVSVEQTEVPIPYYDGEKATILTLDSGKGCASSIPAIVAPTRSWKRSYSTLS